MFKTHNIMNVILFYPKKWVVGWLLLCVFTPDSFKFSGVILTLNSGGKKSSRRFLCFFVKIYN